MQLFQCIVIFISLSVSVSVVVSFPFQNVSSPWEDRVDDLVSRLTLEEVMLQLARGGGGKNGPAPAIPRLGVKKFQWDTECLRGVVLSGKATAFAQSIGLGAMFSKRFRSIMVLLCYLQIVGNVDASVVEELSAGLSSFTVPWYHPSLQHWCPVNVHVTLKGSAGELIVGNVGASVVEKLSAGLSSFTVPWYHPSLQHWCPVNVHVTSERKRWRTETVGNAGASAAEELSLVYQASQFHGIILHFNIGALCMSMLHQKGSVGELEACWDMMHKVARAIGTEVRAKANNYTAHGNYDEHHGLNCLAPMINMMVHPLWGRNQEVYGEDPYLSGRMADAYIRGLQGGDSRYILAASNCKAYLAYAGPENIPSPRFTFDAKVSDRDLRLSFLPAFKQCIQSGTYSYMCSYNSVNGVPMCAHKRLLTDILRTEYGFKGFVMSDMGAIEAVMTDHHYRNTSVETVSAALHAGCNLELGGPGANSIYSLSILNAVSQGLVEESMLREMVKPLFYTRMRLGDFDPPAMNPYSNYNLSLVQNPDHQELAVKAAMKSFVLLKNDGLLPVKKNFKQIAVVGPTADNLAELYGDYNAVVDPRYAVTPLKGLMKLGESVKYASGCPNNKCTTYNDPAGIKAAVQGAQLVVLCIGTGQQVEGEGRDRPTMELPGQQKQLVADVLKYSNGAPVILLLFTAGPVNVTFLDADPRVTVIMQCFFPAQATGTAIYNTITMASEDASPAGRLPYTWYRDADQIPPMVNYSMAGKTYRYFDGVPAYPFGYGLSYTNFSYSNLVYDPVILKGHGHLFVKVTVTNTGAMGSDEVAQVYMSWMTTKEVMPQLQLLAFDRKFVPWKQSVVFEFKIEKEQLAVWTDTNGFVVEKGDVMLYVGGQQPNQKRQVPSNILQGKVHIQDTFKLSKNY